MKLTAKEIAGIIGVSQATLSLVINNKPGISDKTRKKVLEELKSRGYEYLLNEEAFQQNEKQTGTAEAYHGQLPGNEHPGTRTSGVYPGAETNTAYSGAGVGGQTARGGAMSSAQESSSADPRSLAFVTYRVGGELLGYNSFFPLIISGIEEAASRQGFHVIYLDIERERVEEGVDQLRSSGCAGCVIFATELKEEDLPPFDTAGIPYVVLDNYFIGRNLNTVKVNNEQGTWSAVEYLVRHGHKKIGYLKSGVDINSFNERFRRAMEALEALHCETPERYVYEIGYPAENALDGMRKLLQKGADLPTAFIGDNDLVIAGAVKALLEAGYRIPEQISFVGFDDRPICEWMMPELTSVRLPREHFGGEAVQLLTRMLNGEPDLHLKIEIGTNIVERASVAEAKQE